MIERDGKVAIRRIPTMQKYIQVGTSEYVFVVRNSIAMAWVDKSDVDKVLQIKSSSCSTCGQPKQVFYPIDEVHLNRWENGGR